ncbi:heparinase II/III family protein [Paracoccaceae bacterium]|nr:heparinase II/III family protein [Paracoccaceae bacterium]
MRKLIKPKVTERFYGSKPQRSKAWKHLTLYNDKIDSQLEACFLNQTKKLDLPADWNNESPSKLWVYNLHYFEDLLSNNAEEKRNLHLQLLSTWVNENPVGCGNGWEPYPTSLRIVNILKAWLSGLELDEKLLSSVFGQASFLSDVLEKHLLGNHYFVNLKALLFAGVIFKNSRWSSIAENGLLTEIPEQILEDGANFELSPMYHSLILVDMLDMFNLTRAYPAEVSNQLASLLKEYIAKMLTFMEAMAHLDGGVSFFNDSVDGIAPTKAKIESYAEKLGFEINPLDSSEYQIIDNANSGYICATAAGNKLIFDASPVGPDYIPGHAHADTLSFELSIGAQRVFVNSGTSEYGLSPKRHNQRKTASHNTVEVDGKDSSQVWNGFRVANRARILCRSAELNRDQSIVLKASHNGYKSLFRGCIHTRKLTFIEESLAVTDLLQGTFRHAKSRFYFHPDLTVSLKNNLLKVEGPKFILQSDLLSKSASLCNSSWHPEFGVEIPNKVLEVQLEKSQLEIVFAWIKW